MHLSQYYLHGQRGDRTGVSEREPSGIWILSALLCLQPCHDPPESHSLILCHCDVPSQMMRMNLITQRPETLSKEKNQTVSVTEMKVENSQNS